MNIFVTGATGLVGSFVVKQLLVLGHHPRILVRPNSSTHYIEEELPKCDIVEGDVLDYLGLVRHLEGCEMVIHCAGKVSYDSKKRKELYETNVTGTANVVNACLAVGSAKLVHVSSIAALGRPYNLLTINETAQWDESGSNSYYAKTKYLAELEVFRGGEEGLRFSIVNPSVILGPGDPLRSSVRLFPFVQKMPWFYPDGYVNVVDVRDVARIVTAMLSIHHQGRLIVNAQSIPYKELYGMIAQSYGLKTRQMRLPLVLIRAIALLDSVRTRLKGGEPLVTTETLRHLRKRFKYVSLYYHKLFLEPMIDPHESIGWTVKELTK